MDSRDGRTPTPEDDARGRVAPVPSPEPADGTDPAAALDAALAAFFPRHAPHLVSRTGVVAFSGGPDSTALLLALARRRDRGGPAVIAAHLDHAADPGSRERARRAAALAGTLGVPAVVHRRRVAAERHRGESPEAAARRVRYAFLATVATASGAGWIATGHHRDDQAETVLLRLLRGSGLRGLAGIRPLAPVPAAAREELATGSAATTALARSPATHPLDLGTPRDLAAPSGTPRVAVIRPLLDLPRATLEEAVRNAGLRPVHDPTNRDPAVPRNRVRHRLLPRLESQAGRQGTEPPALALARLATHARGAVETVDRRLRRTLRPEPVPGGGVAVERRTLEELAEPLRRLALALLHHLAGAPYPAGAEARGELERQLVAGGAVGCDCGDGWRWQQRGDRLLLRRPTASSPGEFSYILEVPGRTEIAETGAVVRLYRAPVQPWMYRGARERAALALPLAAGGVVTVRNRRPGDRLRPLGAAGTRRLKEVLIDRRVPRGRRDRLPLLCVDDRVAWVPGVTVEHAYRLPEPPPTGATVWVAEVAEP